MHRRCDRIFATFLETSHLFHQNYFGAPQQVNNGIVTAVNEIINLRDFLTLYHPCLQHSHVTVQLIPAVDSKAIPDPKVFAFFKGLNDKDQNGVLSTDLTAGLPAGVYRFCSV